MFVIMGGIIGLHEVSSHVLDAYWGYAMSSEVILEDCHKFTNSLMVRHYVDKCEYISVSLALLYDTDSNTENHGAYPIKI